MYVSSTTSILKIGRKKQKYEYMARESKRDGNKKQVSSFCCSSISPTYISTIEVWSSTLFWKFHTTGIRPETLFSFRFWFSSSISAPLTQNTSRHMIRKYNTKKGQVSVSPMNCYTVTFNVSTYFRIFFSNPLSNFIDIKIDCISDFTPVYQSTSKSEVYKLYVY